VNSPAQNTSDLHLFGASYLYVGLAAIFFLSAWAALFSISCRSDGCIGVAYLAGGGVIALLVQLLVLLPVFCFKRRGSDFPVSHLAALWVVGSVVAFLAPFFFALLLR
jgi:hypothetical protein